MGEILTGDYLTFKAPLGGKGKIGMIGKSTQKTRSGKNILYVADKEETINNMGITYSVKNGIITLNGTSTGSHYITFTNSLFNINEGDYTISTKVLSGSYSGSVGKQVNIDSSKKLFDGGYIDDTVTVEVQNQQENVYLAFYIGSNAIFNNYQIIIQLEEGSVATEIEQYGVSPSPQFPSEIQNVEGNVNVTICNRNIANSNEVYSNMKAFNSQQCSEIIEDEKECIKFDNTSFRPDTLKHFNLINFKFKENTSYTIRGLFKKENQSPSIGLFIQVVYTDGTQDMVDSSANGWIELRLVSNASKTIRNIGFSYSNPGYYYLDKSSIFIGEGNANDYILNQQKKFVFPLEEGQILMEEDYLADDGIHHKRKQFVVDGTEEIYNASLITDKDTVSFNLNKPGAVGPYYGESPIRFCNIYGEDYIKDWGYFSDNPGSLGVGSTTNQLRFVIDNSFIGLVDNSDQEANQEKVANWLKDNNIVVEEEVDEYVEAYTDEQQTIRNLMQNVALYEGTNNIFCTNEITPTLEVETSKLVDDFDFYISSNGYLVFPQYNKKYLTNMSENVILNMPEAVQTTVKIAGKDGDLVLDSSYNSQDFQVVMFTDEGLTPEQKEKERIFINRIFNAMKKNSKTFAFEQSQKFYKVLYSGILEETNYPQHMMFTIPLKSSKPYAYKMSSSYLLGNDTKTSETIEPVGFICTINGPALNPIISFNDYSMEFDNTISEGSKLIIDTNNSTAVLVNSNGIETNAMRYYNHQFPKIMEGENVLKVLSGIDNPNNVFISWYDLTL